jgi:hypothetical protein
MIVDFIIQIFIQFFGFLISRLPNFAGLPSGITNSITFFQTYWDKVSLVFPLDTAFQILALMVSIEVGIFAWHAWWFLYGKLPGKFT